MEETEHVESPRPKSGTVAMKTKGNVSKKIKGDIDEIIIEENEEADILKQEMK